MANVLITGCSSGFGLLAALRFARRGDRVFASMRDTSKAGELEKARDAEKLSIDVIQLDVTDQASVDRAMKTVYAAGPLDVLVNNAGAELRGPVELAEDDEIRWQFETNVLGVVRMVRAVAPTMRERGSGTIVNLSSLTGIVPPPFSGFYAASKHAVEAISEALHYELGPFGVRVAIVEPGQFPTSFRSNIRDARRFAEDTTYRDFYDRFQVALGRLRGEGVAEPDEVAQVIVDAVETQEPKLRYVVGADAQLVTAVRKQLDFEGFEAAMRKQLDWYD